MLGKTLAVGLVAAATLSGCTSGARRAPATQPVGNVEVIEEYWPDGKLKSRMEIVRAADGAVVNHGTFTTWHDNGRKAYEATYVHGQLDGVETTWHKNGRKWTETHYQRGQRHGLRRTWYEDGNISKEEHWVHDRPAGTWTAWEPDGQIKAQQVFGDESPRP